MVFDSLSWQPTLHRVSVMFVTAPPTDEGLRAGGGELSPYGSYILEVAVSVILRYNAPRGIGALVRPGPV